MSEEAALFAQVKWAKPRRHITGTPPKEYETIWSVDGTDQHVKWSHGAWFAKSKDTGWTPANVIGRGPYTEVIRVDQTTASVYTFAPTGEALLAVPSDTPRRP